MQTDPAAVTRRRRPRPSRRRLRHLLLAASLVMMALSVVGMHQLSIGHDIATSSAGSAASTESAHHSHQGDEIMPPAPTEHPGDITTAGTTTASVTAGTTGSPGDTCPDCSEHQLMLGSCLLALTLLVLSWTLIPPRLRHLPPFLLPRLAPTMPGPALGRLVPPLSLVELSLRRT